VLRLRLQVCCMNIEKINEPIRVLAGFSGGTCNPLRFSWSGREYRIEAIIGRWIDRNSEGYSLNFSVQVGSETYYIHFSSAQVQWWLDQVIVA